MPMRRLWVLPSSVRLDPRARIRLRARTTRLCASTIVAPQELMQGGHRAINPRSSSKSSKNRLCEPPVATRVRPHLGVAPRGDGENTARHSPLFGQNYRHSQILFGVFTRISRYGTCEADNSFLFFSIKFRKLYRDPNCLQAFLNCVSVIAIKNIE